MPALQKLGTNLFHRGTQLLLLQNALTRAHTHTNSNVLKGDPWFSERKKQKHTVMHLVAIGRKAGALHSHTAEPSNDSMRSDITDPL